VNMTAIWHNDGTDPSLPLRMTGSGGTDPSLPLRMTGSRVNMAAIWHNDGSDWRLLSPTGFPDEATLHNLVEQALNLLPLAGTPRLIVLGREVQLAGNRSSRNE